MTFVEELSARYGWPLKIRARGYIAHLVGAQPMNEGDPEPIYRFPGGDSLVDRCEMVSAVDDEQHRNIAFPRREVEILLAYMKEQMYGEPKTEWSGGNEHDRMSAAVDLLETLVQKEVNRFAVEYCPCCDIEVVIHADGITACPSCGYPLAPCSVCYEERGDCVDPCPYGCTGGEEDAKKPITKPPVTDEDIAFVMAHR